MRKDLKYAFTLAEVLITLAIIGVVAAMTLPTLIQKHQKKVLGERFKQSLSILSQGFQKMMADEGVTDFDDTEWKKHDCEYIILLGEDYAGEPPYKCPEIAKQYFNIVDIIDFEHVEESRYYFQNSDNGYYVLKNGLMLMPAGSSYYIDTNGFSKPNREGYDIFSVVSLENGLIVPQYSRADYGINVPEDYESNILKCKYQDSSNPDASYYEYCGAYLYENGFVMDY